MRFASPYFLWLLAGLPLMALYLVFIRPANLPAFRFSSFALLKDMVFSRQLRWVVLGPGFLRLAAMVFLILALARPQRGLKSEELTTKATDIMICLDASHSMLSVDFKPENRFAVAKQTITDFIKGRQYDRMGLVVFAVHAVTLCPLTTDRTALLNIVDQLEVGVIPSGQTAIGLGLATSVNRLKDSVAKSKIIILLTDGANNAGNIDPVTAANTAAAHGIRIYAIGAGSPEGGLMPVTDPVFGTRHVRTPDDLDEDLLLRIAQSTGGNYYRAKTADALKLIFKEIDAMEKTDINIKEFVDYDELYWPFLLIGFFLLFVEFAAAKTLFRTVP